MPKISFSKESLEGAPPIPNGAYDVRLEGFEPKYSKNRDSVNLNPVLKVVNHATESGKRVFDNMNTRAGWIIEAMSHAGGISLVQNPVGGFDIPGDFMGPDDDPEKWNYMGPLSGQVFKCMVKQVDNTKGQMVSKIDQWFCQIPGCTSKHPNNLAG